MSRPTALLVLLAACGPLRPPEDGGTWVRTTWSTSRRQGDGAVTNRVNSPDTATGRFKDRPEAKATGLLRLELRDAPSALSSAELVLELWGGHPGTANKTVAVNGGPPRPLPEVGAAAGHCTYSHPALPLRPEELRAGENLFQFACERGTTFWGHFLFEVAALRAVLRDPPLPYRARLRAALEGETARLELDGPPEGISEVVFDGFYDGFDENGDGGTLDWHGFTKEGRPEARVAVVRQAPFRADWDLSMLPDQPGPLRARATVRFASDPSLEYATVPVGIPFPARPGFGVRRLAPASLPVPFWSRASKAKTCVIELDVDPSLVERAELHVAIWDGGKGKTPDPFTLNGRGLDVAGAGRHDLLYRVVPLDPSLLRRGPNEIRVLSDTEHHGLEVLLPGPALLLRSRLPR